MKPELRARLDELRAKHRPAPPPSPDEPQCEDCGHARHEGTLGLGTHRYWCGDEACLCGVDACARCGVRDRTDLIELERMPFWAHRCRHCGLETDAVMYA